MASKKPAKKSAEFPVMFYHSIPAGKEKKNAVDSDARQKRILLWSGVALVMAFLIFCWGWNLKKQLYQFPPGLKTDLSFLKTENSIQTPTVLKSARNLPQLFQQALAASSVSSTLSAAKLQDLKKKIEQKK